MLVQELSDQFDVLFSNITSNQAPGLNEYEKSVFLTKAQEEIIKNYFNPKANPKGEGFDDSPKRQADFATLISHKVLSSSSAGTFDVRAKAYKLPDDMFLCLNEQFSDGTTPLTVVPISYEEYDRLMAKPYKFPPKYQVWRLITKNTLAGATVHDITPGEDYKDVTYNIGLNATETFRFKIVTSKTSEVSVTIHMEESGENHSPVVIDGNDITFNLPMSYAGTADYYKFYNDYIVDDTYRDQIFSIIDSITWPSAAEEAVFGGLADVVLTAQATETTRVTTTTETTAEFIGRFIASSPTYRIRYVKRPNPIILTNFNDGGSNPLSIQGKSTVQALNLPDELYEEILQRAVELAKVAWTSNGQDNVQLVMQAGQRSE